MSSTITVPQGFSYVGAAIVSTSFLTAWQAFLVGSYRRKASVKYPQAYAEKAETENSKDALRFNCAQRAHQNTLENIPTVLATTLIIGLKYPIPAAAACAGWVLSRVIYTIGYTSGEPAKRNARGGGIGNFLGIGLLLGSAWTVVDLIRAGI